MNRPSYLRARVWMVPLGVVALILGHGAVLYYVSSHLALSGAVISGLIALIVIRHLRWLAPLYSFFRRRFGRPFDN